MADCARVNAIVVWQTMTGNLQKKSCDRRFVKAELQIEKSVKDNRGEKNQT